MNGDLLLVVCVIDMKMLWFVLFVVYGGDGGWIDVVVCDGRGVGLLFVDFVCGLCYWINGCVMLCVDLLEVDVVLWVVGSVIVELVIVYVYGNCGMWVVWLKLVW